ncbi:hypothetical protein U9M48_000125 [Paspalum notatum var. saurae]|uniref:Uncharacterized protein n=1 Tax=Paspalum notatum var. saurae TaxID=547442 RepID=A0AAQ3SEE5_PASNO
MALPLYSVDPRAPSRTRLSASPCPLRSDSTQDATTRRGPESGLRPTRRAAPSLGPLRRPIKGMRKPLPRPSTPSIRHSSPRAPRCRQFPSPEFAQPIDPCFALRGPPTKLHRRFLDAESRLPSLSTCAHLRRPPVPSPALFCRLRRRSQAHDVDPPVEFEEQPPEASEQQQGINFEEGKYNINTTQ